MPPELGCSAHHAQHHPAVLPPQQQLDENSPLGDLLGGVLDVPSCQIGECQRGSTAKTPLRLLSSSLTAPGLHLLPPVARNGSFL